VRRVQDEGHAVAATGFFDENDFDLAEKKQLVNTPLHDPVGLNKVVIGTKVTTFDAMLVKWGRTSESAGKIGCIAGLAKRWLTVPIEDFDTDVFAINVMNGTLRFERTGKNEAGVREARCALTEHRRDDLLTRLAPVEYLPEAEAPVYDALIAWAQPETRMRRYLHQWGGYSSSGHTGAQILHFWYGKGANGKSTVIDAWADTLGDYSGTIGIETFLDQGIKKRGDQATPDLAKLGGVRLLRASEPDRGAKLNEALIKAATGGEPMSVRALHKGFFDLKPSFKITMAGNHKVDVPGTDEGIWRRLKLVPWPSFRAIGERDEDLPRKLKAERAGIFLALVDGLLDWMQHGFIEPDTVSEATREFRDESDPLARFLSACCVEEAGVREQSSRLHAVFCAWAKAAGEREWSNKGLSRAMIDKGFKRVQSNGMFFEGLKLVREIGDFIDGEGKVIAQQVIDTDAQFGRNDSGDLIDDDDILP
jgi:DNA primase